MDAGCPNMGSDSDAPHSSATQRDGAYIPGAPFFGAGLARVRRLNYPPVTPPVKRILDSEFLQQVLSKS